MRSKAMIRMVTEEGLAEKCSKNASKIRETHSVEKISEQNIGTVESGVQAQKTCEQIEELSKFEKIYKIKAF